MRHTIHHLRQKPVHHKRAIAFLIAFSVTLTIFSIWFTAQPFLHTTPTTDTIVIDQNTLEVIRDNAVASPRGAGWITE